MSGNEPSLVAAFEDEIRKLGYVNGRNVHLATRLARPNTSDTREHVAELTSLGLDFIVVAALPHALAVRAANPAMPMVIITCPGMVEKGFAQSSVSRLDLEKKVRLQPSHVACRELSFPWSCDTTIAAPRSSD